MAARLRLDGRFAAAAAVRAIAVRTWLDGRFAAQFAIHAIAVRTSLDIRMLTRRMQRILSFR
jgi:hypothetical protein